MKKLITILKYTSLGLSIISIFFITYSIINLVNLDSHTSYINRIYSALGNYSGLYKFTFLVCAFWVTLRQLEISQSNYKCTLNQIKFTQDDIVEKRKKDITNDTLKQCNFYLQELQIAFKELIETNIMSGMTLEWHHLSTLISPILKEKYPSSYEKFEKIERATKNQVLITLYKLEAFSSLFIHGNLDKQLANDIIGNTFTKQVGFLLGLISYFRQDTNDKFGRNIIALYNEWKTKEQQE